jgi:hypothetical protein
MVIPIVVEVEYAVQLVVDGYVQLFRVLDALAERLTSVLFHLDVVELSGIIHKKAFLQMRVLLMRHNTHSLIRTSLTHTKVLRVRSFSLITDDALHVS